MTKQKHSPLSYDERAAMSARLVELEKQLTEISAPKVRRGSKAQRRKQAEQYRQDQLDQGAAYRKAKREINRIKSILRATHDHSIGLSPSRESAQEGDTQSNWASINPTKKKKPKPKIQGALRTSGIGAYSLGSSLKYWR
ncbi:hypothetical protein [Haematobacter massiliensis]|uniref:hypothetical protein n=1 Tax=Haematobacter massiliensis TaxID=195105 RepID=UPI0023F16B83|nr:hypothetical protein [Haematobacter massiliensis]